MSCFGAVDIFYCQGYQHENDNCGCLKNLNIILAFALPSAKWEIILLVWNKKQFGRSGKTTTSGSVGLKPLDPASSSLKRERIRVNL